MARFEIKKLPKGFRYLLTIKEIKNIEFEGGFQFKTIRTGNISSSEHFEMEKNIQSSFRPFSLHFVKIDNRWDTNIFQSGFREELLPHLIEDDVKSQARKKIIEFIKVINSSLETDNYRNPQLWSTLNINNGRPEFLWKVIA